MHVPIDGVAKKRLWSVGQDMTQMPVQMSGAVTLRKDPSPVETIQASPQRMPRPYRALVRHGAPELPELEVMVKAMGNAEFIRHPGIGADAHGPIARLT